MLITPQETTYLAKQVVKEFYNLDDNDLTCKDRHRHKVIGRQLSMYIMNKHTNLALKAIGNEFGGRDHSTVIHGVRTINDLMETDKVFVREFNIIYGEFLKKTAALITTDRAIRATENIQYYETLKRLGEIKDFIHIMEDSILAVIEQEKLINKSI